MSMVQPTLWFRLILPSIMTRRTLGEAVQFGRVPLDRHRIGDAAGWILPRSWKPNRTLET